MFLIEKATSGKRSALLDTHQAQLGLLQGTTKSKIYLAKDDGYVGPCLSCSSKSAAY
jgi:hypothetical protein